MNYRAASYGISIDHYDDVPRIRHPERFNRESSPSFAWILAKNMRE